MSAIKLWPGQLLACRSCQTGPRGCSTQSCQLQLRPLATLQPRPAATGAASFCYREQHGSWHLQHQSSEPGQPAAVMPVVQWRRAVPPILASCQHSRQGNHQTSGQFAYGAPSTAVSGLNAQDSRLAGAAQPAVPRPGHRRSARRPTRRPRPTHPAANQATQQSAQRVQRVSAPICRPGRAYICRLPAPHLHHNTLRPPTCCNSHTPDHHHGPVEGPPAGPCGRHTRR